MFRIRNSQIGFTARTLVLLAAALVPHDGLAGRNECGQPNNTGSIPTTASALYVLRASVELAGNICPKCMCDVNNDGSVNTNDALRVLKAAVALPVSLNCPNSDTDECVTCSASDAVANAENLKKALTSLPSPTCTSPTKLCGSLVVFRCSGTVPIAGTRNETVGSNGGPTANAPGQLYWWADSSANNGITGVTANYVTIDGRGSDGNAITFEESPLCYQQCYGVCSQNNAQRCSGFGQCSNSSGPCCHATSGTCAYTQGEIKKTDSTRLVSPISSSDSLCHGVDTTTLSPLFRTYPDAGDRTFLPLEGNNITVRNMTIRGFSHGISFGGINGTATNVTFDRQCDHSVSTKLDSGYGAVVDGTSTIKNGVDKCVQIAKGATTLLYWGDVTTDPRPSQCALPASSAGPHPDRGCYHISFFDTVVEGCRTPFKSSAGSEQGDSSRAYLSNVDVVETAGNPDSMDLFGCSGSEFAGNAAVADFIDFTTARCDGGLRLAGLNSQYNVRGAIGGSLIEKAEERGIVSGTKGNFTAKVRNTKLYDNGGYNPNPGAPNGGAGVEVNAKLDLGTNGTTDKGNNKICCNMYKANQSSTPVDRDVHNKSGNTIYAKGNFWCDGPDVYNESGTTLTDSAIPDPFQASSNPCDARP